MSTTIAKKIKKSAPSDANMIASEVFAKVFQAYMECNDEVQAAIREMAEIVNDTTATENEKDSALLTIADALFPTHHNGHLGVDLEECESSAPEEVKTTLQLNEQETTFSERVTAVLKAKNMTQSDLADASGVGQPAVSMLLSRQCRPQRSTVHRIAEALEIPPNELWTNYER